MGKFEKDTGAGRFFKDFKKYHGLPGSGCLSFNQSDLICDMAKHEDFIVMGRCADVVLTNHHIPHISIFITASFDQRVRRMMEINSLNYKQAEHLLKKLDKRMNVIIMHTPVKNGVMRSTMICVLTVQVTESRNRLS